MSITTTPSEKQGKPIHYGPPTGILALVYVSLFIASLVVANVMTNGAAFPRPFGDPVIAQQYYFQFADIVRLDGFLQFAAAIPLGIFTSAVTSRLQFLGVKATGVNIAMFGGIFASLMMALSGLSGWVLSQPGISHDLSTMLAVQLFGFVTGGIGHIAGLGLLLAGVSVPSLFGHYIPRWLAWMGLVIAGVAELSTLGLVFTQIYILLPLARFSSFLWLIAMGFMMIKSNNNNPS
jgi:hypothetical protein